ncbi:MAG: hypothetical protein II135_05485 [Clostridia bacterium]|nr:hypothetical protein [Clostridia bacterium]
MKIIKTYICLTLAAVMLLSACSCGIIGGDKKQTVEVKTLNPELKSEVTVKEIEAPQGLDGANKFEAVGKWYDVGSEGYDGLPLSGDVLLTVSFPGKTGKEDIGGYVFIYFDEKSKEYRYLFPDSYDLSAGTMSIDLPHFSWWGTAKLTKEEQIEAFLDSYSTKLAVERGKRRQAAAKLEPYVRAKVEAMGLTKQAAADLIQSTVNYLGGSFTGDNADYIDMGTNYVTTLARGFYDGDEEAAVNGLEDAVNNALMNSWDELEFSDRLDKVLGSEFAGSTVSTLLSSSSGIARMAGYMAGGDMKEAMKELGGIMKGVHPAAEFTTNAVAFLGAAVNEAFTNWKSNQIEELYQIYKNGAEDIWGNEVVAGNRESFLTYLNTSSGFTMAKGVGRFYNLDKIEEICEKYGWPYETYEELPEKYRDIFEKRAENGLMEYFELRLQQEKTAEQIKSSERACIETMMSVTNGALSSTNSDARKFFHEESSGDYDLTARLERIVNVRRFVSQYVDETKLTNTAEGFNYGDVINWWVTHAAQNDKKTAIELLLDDLEENGLIKEGIRVKAAGLDLKTFYAHTVYAVGYDYCEIPITATNGATVNGRVLCDIYFEDEVKAVIKPAISHITPDANGNFKIDTNGIVLEGNIDFSKLTGSGTYSFDVALSKNIQSVSDFIAKYRDGSGKGSFETALSGDYTLHEEGTFTVVYDEKEIGKDVLRFNLTGTKKQTLNGMRIGSISGFNSFGESPDFNATSTPFSLTTEREVSIRIDYTFTK